MSNYNDNTNIRKCCYFTSLYFILSFNVDIIRHKYRINIKIKFIDISPEIEQHDDRVTNCHSKDHNRCKHLVPNYSNSLFMNAFAYYFEYFLVEIFQPLLLPRRDGRAVECGGLENR